MDKPAVVSTTNKTPEIGITLGGLRQVRQGMRDKILSNQKQRQEIPLQDDTLKAVWQQILEQFASDKKVYRSALEACVLSHENEEILIQGGVVAIDFLKAERLSLLDFVKRFFHNEQINLRFIQMADSKTVDETPVLSTREVFEQMAARNPALRKLKDQLGLDFEYS